MAQVYFQRSKPTDKAVEFKRLFTQVVQDWKARSPNNQLKNLAVALGCSTSTLSHWMGEQYQEHLPGYLISEVCRFTSDWSLSHFDKRRAS